MNMDFFFKFNFSTFYSEAVNVEELKKKIKKSQVSNSFMLSIHAFNMIYV